MGTQCTWPGVFTIPGMSEERWRPSVTVAAVIERDGARAEQLMREHVYFAGLLLRDNYERLSGKTVPPAHGPDNGAT